jgi:hypothetical protein
MTSAGQPMILDVEGKDIQGEGARLRARGPATVVELPGSVRVWAVSGYRGLRQILSDPFVPRSANLHWSAWRRGEIPENWPLRVWASLQNMGNSYGGEHRRLRAPLAVAFTAPRAAGLRPRNELITTALLDKVAAQPENEPVDHIRMTISSRAVSIRRATSRRPQERRSQTEEWRPASRPRAGRQLVGLLKGTVRRPEVISTTDRGETHLRL